MKLPQWLLLATVGLALLMVMMDITILYTALPGISKDLDASPSTALWAINIYPLITAGLLLGTGTLGDRVGHRQMFIVGLSIFGLASLGASLCTTAEQLVAARAMQAIGASAIMPATLALIRVGFLDPRQRALAISVWAAMELVGAILGPIIGGMLLERFTWHAIFLVNVPVVAGLLVAACIVAPKGRMANATPWDLTSSAQALMALSSLVVAIEQAVKPSPHWQSLAGALLISALSSRAFVMRQQILAHPLLDFSLFRRPYFCAGFVGAATVPFATSGILLVVSQRFQLSADFTPLQSGALTCAFFLGTLPSTLLGGAFADRLGVKPLMVGGLIVGGAGAAICAHTLALGMPWLITGLVVSGVGLGATISVASTAVVSSAPAHRAGMASSIEEVAYELGTLIAVAVLGSLLTATYASFVNMPSAAPPEASMSIGHALSAATTTAEPLARIMIDAAHTAFDRSYAAVMSVIAATLWLGALWIFLILRHQGSQPVTCPIGKTF